MEKLECHVDKSEDQKRPKSYITWVPSNSIKSEVRVYNNIFTVPEPSDQWEDELNSDSVILQSDALVDPSVCDVVDKKDVDVWKSNYALQFERMGYFCVDIDTTFDSEPKEGKPVFNRTVLIFSSR